MSDERNQAITLLDAVTGTGAGTAIGPVPAEKTFQAVVAGTGAVSATVLVEVSNNGVDWLTLATITLSGTTRSSDGFASNTRWRDVRGNVTAISAGAAVSLFMGV